MKVRQGLYHSNYGKAISARNLADLEALRERIIMGPFELE